MQTRNEPTLTGAKIGAQLSRLHETAVSKLREQGVTVEDPCKSCAFRLGTYPNQCISTVADAMKCIAEKDPFACHARFEPDGSRSTCRGYEVAALATAALLPVKLPYEFSHIDE